MEEFGIWSGAAGGFIETGFWSEQEAKEAIPALIADGEDEDDLSTLEICPEHEEQPKLTCEECSDDSYDAEDTENEDED